LVMSCGKPHDSKEDEVGGSNPPPRLLKYFYNPVFRPRFIA